MSIDETDVVARLRAGADSMTDHAYDAGDVLAGSKRALRRRRSWQALGAGTTAAVVTFALALAGSVPVPGVGEVTLPGGERIRELVGLEPEPATCVPENLTVEWGEVSSRTEHLAFAFDNKEAGSGLTTEESPPLGEVAGPDLLPGVVQALKVRAAEDRQFPFVRQIDDPIDRFEWRWDDIPDGWGVWWTTSDLRSLPGVARCGDLPVTSRGEKSAEFTITSWNGEDASGFASCANPPAEPTRVEREALSNCNFVADLDD